MTVLHYYRPACDLSTMYTDKHSHSSISGYVVSKTKSKIVVYKHVVAQSAIKTEMHKCGVFDRQTTS